MEKQMLSQKIKLEILIIVYLLSSLDANIFIYLIVVIIFINTNYHNKTL